MNILELIENTGNLYKKASQTAGGEYKGACPWCGGDDRFSIHPEKDHYVCRRCKKAGDTLQFYRDFHELSYHDACIKAGQTPEFKKTFLIDKIAKTENWNPRETHIPCKAWQDKAEAVAFASFKYLMSGAGKIHREYLHARGLSLDTIKAARIGWNDKTLIFDRAAWGLGLDANKKGKSKNIWIPRGFVIPFFLDGSIIRIRIRQNEPIGNDRYILVAGSGTGYFIYPSKNTALESVLITEAEFDGWACWEAFGDLTMIQAIGNSTARPDIDSHSILKNNTPLLCLDNDEAGRHEVQWWKRQYPQSVTCPVSQGKDPGEAYEQGVDLRAWFQKQAEARGIAVDMPICKKTKTPIAKNRSTVQPSKKTSKKINKICLHGHFCHSVKDNYCLIAKAFTADMSRCPNDKWWTYKKKNSPITQIILGPGVKKDLE